MIKNTIKALLLMVVVNLNVFSQDVIELAIIEDEGVTLSCNSDSTHIIWQKSFDGEDWFDIQEDTAKTLVYQPYENIFLRAIEGNHCGNITNTVSITISDRPGEIRSSKNSFEKEVKLAGCIYVPNPWGDGYYQGTCHCNYHYTLEWDKGDAEGVLISNNKNFLPEDGKTYSPDFTNVLHVSYTNTWYYDDKFAHFSTKYKTHTLYLYAFDSNITYSNGQEVEIYILGNYNWNQIGCDCD